MTERVDLEAMRALYRGDSRTARTVIKNDVFALIAELTELRAQAGATAEPEPEPESWWYAQSADAESWDGCCSSRDEAIQEGHANFQGEAFYVTQGERPTCAEFAHYFDARRALEDMIEYGADNGLLGDDTELTFTDEAACEREVRGVIAKHLVRPTWWAMMGHAERIEPPEATDG